MMTSLYCIKGVGNFNIHFNSQDEDETEDIGADCIKVSSIAEGRPKREVRCSSWEDVWNVSGTFLMSALLLSVGVTIVACEIMCDSVTGICS